MSNYFRKEIVSFFIVQLFAVFALSIFGAYLPIALNNLAATALIIGIVFTSRNILQIFLRIPFSELSQIIGRKPLIISGIIGYTIGLGLMYFADHWSTIFIAATIVGIGMSLHWPAVFSYIGDVSNGDYGKINGIIFMGQDIGVIIGSLMATYLLNNDIVTVKGLFGIAFVIMLFGSIISIIILPEVLEDEHRKHVTSKFSALYMSFVNSMRSLIEQSRIYTLRIIFLFELLITFTEFFVTSFIPILIVESLGYETSVVAAIILGSTLVQIVFKPYFGKIFDKYGFRGPVIIALSIVSLMIYALTLTTTFWELLAVYTIMMSAIFICYIASTGATSNSVAPAKRGLAMGVLGVYISSGRTASSVILSPILGILENRTGSRAEGLTDLFKLSAILIFALTLLMALYSRQLKVKPIDDGQTILGA